MSRSTRFLAGAALAGVAAVLVRRLGPRAHEACRAGCGRACEHATDETASETTMREVQHAA